MLRTRNSVRLTKEGLEQVNAARRKKGWTKRAIEWFKQAYVSESTLKRFVRGKPISPENFKNLCKVLGIEEWQTLVDWEESDSTAVPQASGEYPNQDISERKPLSQSVLTVTGTFNSHRRLEVEMASERLADLLSDSKVNIRETDDPAFPSGVFIQGLFNPELQSQIEATEEHLKTLLLSCTVTMTVESCIYITRRDEVLNLAAQHQEKLKDMGVKSLALFGSVAREEATPDSDVDFLVEFDDRPIGLFDLSRVRLYLEDVLGSKVDMGTEDSLREHLRERVLREKIRVF